jgi:hypothetical protein
MVEHSLALKTTKLAVQPAKAEARRGFAPRV